MTGTKEKAAEAFKKLKADARRAAEAPTYRTVLMAASVGVLIGLLLRR
jgi:ElaB/YqjD/DUF883 family membrane-anchored ribosome-binding protein